ncbi:MAG: SPFH/Band 7/PHB domain protein, partial [Allopontixanthobacter sediminis]
FIAQEYTKAVGKFATSPNAKTLLFPIEATQLIGSLGGIGELLGDVMKPGTGNVTTQLPEADPRERVRVPRAGETRAAVPRSGDS